MKQEISDFLLNKGFNFSNFGDNNYYYDEHDNNTDNGFCISYSLLNDYVEVFHTFYDWESNTSTKHALVKYLDFIEWYNTVEKENEISGDILFTIPN